MKGSARGKGSAAGKESPSFVIILLTMLAAVFALSAQAPELGERWKYPVLSQQDPVRVQFLVGEHARHVALAESGMSRLDYDHGGPRPDLEGWRELQAELGLLNAQGLLDDWWGSQLVATVHALGVLMAGYGSTAAMGKLLELDPNDAPGYVRPRLQELRAEQWGPDLARAKTAGQWSVGLWALSYAVLAGGPLALLVLFLGKRFYRRPEVAKPPGLPLFEALFVFVWAQAALSATDWLLAQSSGLEPFALDWLPSTVLAVMAVVLVRAVSGTWAASPFARMLVLPAASQERRYLLLLTVLGLGAWFGVSHLIQLVAFQFQAHSRPGEGAMESVLYGAPFAAWVGAVVAVTVVPFGEELLFRGVLFGGLARRMSVHWAALLSASVFSLWHGYGLLASLGTLASAYIMARIYARTGSLLPCIAMHATNNAVAALWELACRA